METRKKLLALVESMVPDPKSEGAKPALRKTARGSFAAAPASEPLGRKGSDPLGRKGDDCCDRAKCAPGGADWANVLELKTVLSIDPARRSMFCVARSGYDVTRLFQRDFGGKHQRVGEVRRTTFKASTISRAEQSASSPAASTRLPFAINCSAASREPWSSSVTFTDVDHSNYLILYCLIKLSFVAAVFFAFLLWLFQPIVLENPGVAAYQPPPATRLVPLPRKIETTEVPPARNLAAASQQETASGAFPVKKSSTRVAKLKPARKIVPPSWYAERAFAYERRRTEFRGSGAPLRFWF